MGGRFAPVLSAALLGRYRTMSDPRFGRRRASILRSDSNGATLGFGVGQTIQVQMTPASPITTAVATSVATSDLHDRHSPPSLNLSQHEFVDVCSTSVSPMNSIWQREPCLQHYPGAVHSQLQRVQAPVDDRQYGV